MVQGIHLQGDFVNQFVGHLFIIKRAIEEGLNNQLSRGQRRAQFVRDVGHKLAAGAAETLQFGNIVNSQRHGNDILVGSNGPDIGL